MYGVYTLCPQDARALASPPWRAIVRQASSCFMGRKSSSETAAAALLPS